MVKGALDTLHTEVTSVVTSRNALKETVSNTVDSLVDVVHGH